MTAVRLALLLALLAPQRGGGKTPPPPPPAPAPVPKAPPAAGAPPAGTYVPPPPGTPAVRPLGPAAPAGQAAPGQEGAPAAEEAPPRFPTAAERARVELGLVEAQLIAARARYAPWEAAERGTPAPPAAGATAPGPDPAGSEAAEPEAAGPGVGTPEAPTSEDSAPETPEPEAAAPEAGTPEAAATEAPAPEAAAPAAAPAAAAPPSPFPGGIEAARAYDEALAAAESALARIAPADLDDRRAVDRAWIGAWIRAERTLAAGLAPERTDPRLALAEIEAVLAPLLPAEPDARPDATALRPLLAAVPARLARATRETSFPCPVRADLAALDAVELEALLALLEHALGDAGGALAAELALASSAVRDYRAWLAEERESGEPRRLGKREWETAVAALTGADADVRVVAPRLLRELARLAGELEGRAVPHAPLGAKASAIAEEIAAAAAGGLAFARGEGLVATDAPELLVRVETPVVRGAPAVRLDAAPPPRGPALVVTLRGSAWTPDVLVARAVELSGGGRVAEALRRGYPGEAAWLAWTRAAETPAQRHLWNRAMREGLGLYALERATRPGEGPIAPDEALCVAALRAQLVETARLLASLEIHASELPLERAEELFAKRTGFPPDAARYEVRMALADPMAGIGALACAEIVELERRIAPGTASAAAWKEVARLLAAVPSARPVDVLVLGIREAR